MSKKTLPFSTSIWGHLLRSSYRTKIGADKGCFSAPCNDKKPTRLDVRCYSHQNCYALQWRNNRLGGTMFCFAKNLRVRVCQFESIHYVYYYTVYDMLRLHSHTICWLETYRWKFLWVRLCRSSFKFLKSPSLLWMQASKWMLLVGTILSINNCLLWSHVGLCPEG